MEAVNKTLLACSTVDVDATVYKNLGLSEDLVKVHVVSDIPKKDYPSRYLGNPLSIQGLGHQPS